MTLKWISAGLCLALPLIGVNMALGHGVLHSVQFSSSKMQG